MSAYPDPADIIFIGSMPVTKVYANSEWNGATARVVTAKFTDCDRPAHLLGVGGDEGEAVTDLYRELRDHEQMLDAMRGYDE